MKNPNATLTRGCMEWGRKARKHEDHLRGMRRRGRIDNITEGLAEMDEDVTPRCDVCDVACEEADEWCGECGCCRAHCQGYVGCDTEVTS